MKQFITKFIIFTVSLFMISSIFTLPVQAKDGTDLYEFLILDDANLLTQEEENAIANLDWNCLSNDSAGATTKEEILESIIETSTNKNSLVVLMHDAGDKILTYETLQDVINYFKEQGYVFKDMYDIIK